MLIRLKTFKLFNRGPKTKMDKDIKRVYRDDVKFTHDLYKAELARMKKNISYTPRNPRIEEVEHCHWFHSHDSSGRPQKYTSATGGHFHEILHTVVDKKTGETRMTCGPALAHRFKKLKNGKTKTVLETISWFDENSEKEIKDDHVHELSYRFSEEISPSKRKTQLAEDQQKLKGLQPKTKEERIAAE